MFWFIQNPYMTVAVILFRYVRNLFNLRFKGEILEYRIQGNRWWVSSLGINDNFGLAHNYLWGLLS